MALTAASFKARWAEFSATSDAKVEAELAAATRRCDERLFGDRLDDAIGLLAAHLIVASPGGTGARLEAGDGSSAYFVEWDRLARACAGGPFTLGQELA